MDLTEEILVKHLKNFKHHRDSSTEKMSFIYESDTEKYNTLLTQSVSSSSLD